jgi:hypothetical protein
VVETRPAMKRLPSRHWETVELRASAMTWGNPPVLPTSPRDSTVPF